MATVFSLYQQVIHPEYGIGTIREIVGDNIIVSFDQNVTNVVISREEQSQLEFYDYADPGPEDGAGRG